MNNEILKKIKSPFNNKFIGELIKKYISCGCDDILFYSEINNLQTNNVIDNTYTNKLIKNIFDTGAYKYDIYAKQDTTVYLYEYNDTWITVSSEQDPMKEEKRNTDKKMPLIYRVYLNLKGKDKSEFVLNYINKCKEHNLPYKFKFAKKDDRNDQIILLSGPENFEENLDIIEELTQNIKLGDLPMLVGEYKTGIGIAEEYYNRAYSPTQVKLLLVRASVKKYLCDYKNDFAQLLSDDENAKIDKYITDFEYVYNNQIEEKEFLGDYYEDFNQKYYQKKKTIECAKEHIENDRDAYRAGKGLLELGNAIKQIYSNHEEHFITKVTQNYQMIGTEVWGFSKDFIFSNETEERFAKKTEEITSKPDNTRIQEEFER